MSEASGSTSSASQSLAWSDANSTSAISVTYGVLQRLAYAVNQSVAMRRLKNVVLAILFVQMLTVPIEQTALASHSLVSAARWIAIIRAPVASDAVTTVLLYASIAAVGLSFITVFLPFLQLYRGAAAANSRLLDFCSRILWWHHVFVFPVLFICFSSLRNAFSSSLGEIKFAVAVITLIFLALGSTFSSLYIGDFLPGTVKTAIALPRSRMSITVAFFAISISRAFALESSRPWIHALTSLLSFGGLLYLHIRRPPFWSKTANCAYCGVLTALSLAAVVQVAGSFVDDSIIPFVASIAVMIPGAVGGFFVALLRMRYSERFWTRNLPAESVKIEDTSDLELLLHRIFGVDAATAAAMLPRAMELISVAKENFSREATVHYCHGLLLYAIAHDPRGAIVHLRVARRLRMAPDRKFLVSSLIQICQTASQDREKREEVEIVLATVNKHHKLCRLFTGRFWQLLVRSHSDSLDLEQLLQHVRNASYHRGKCEDLLQELMRENPHSVAAMRAWARYLVELKNDQESAEQALMLSDQYEEEQSKRHKRSVRAVPKPENLVQTGTMDSYGHMKHPELEVGISDSGKNVRFGPTGGKTNKVHPKDETDEMSAEPVLEDKEVSRLGQDTATFSDQSSMSLQSAGTSRAEVTAHARAMRRKIEAAKSNVLSKLHVAVLATLFVLIAGSTANYAISVSTMQQYTITLEGMSSTITARAYSTFVVLKIREYEMAQLAGDNATSVEVCRRVSDAIKNFADSLNMMFKQSDTYSSISNFWQNSPLDVKFYVPRNLSDYWSGATEIRTLRLFDAGTTFINSANFVCNRTLASMGGIPDFRAMLTFRYVIDNGPTVIVSKMRDIGRMYSEMSKAQALRVQQFLFGFFPATIALTIATIMFVYWPILTLIRKERKSVVHLFLDIPKSTIINTYEKVSLGDDDDSGIDSVMTKKSLTSTFKLNLVFFGGMQLMTVAIVVIFAFALSFSQSDANKGLSLAAAGTRLNTVTEMLYWDTELVTQDKTTGTRQYFVNWFYDAYKRFINSDDSLKYGIGGVTSDLKTDSSLYNLWYQRECPSYIQLPSCKGLSLLLRAYVDRLRTFAGAWDKMNGTNDTMDPTVFATYYSQPKDFRDTIHDWLSEDLAFEEQVSSNKEKKASTIITVAFWVCLPATCLFYFVIRYYVGSVGTEIEQFV